VLTLFPYYRNVKILQGGKLKDCEECVRHLERDKNTLTLVLVNEVTVELTVI